MGWRYRKSINLGGGFIINLSKSGIGYSWGFPGYRHTYSANGTQRKTYSIPGTEISYVEESGKRNNNPTNENVRYDDNTKLITGDVKYYKNQNISSMGKDDELLKQINKLRTIDILANVCLVSIVHYIFKYYGGEMSYNVLTEYKDELSKIGMPCVVEFIFKYDDLTNYKKEYIYEIMFKKYKENILFDNDISIKCSIPNNHILSIIKINCNNNIFSFGEKLYYIK